MASRKKNPSPINLKDLPEMKDTRIGIVVSEWNDEITAALYAGCLTVLIDAKMKNKNMIRVAVPESFELPSAAKMLIENRKLDAVIYLGCIIKGETRHDEYIAHAVARGIMDLNLRYNIPFIFDMLTCDTMEQAHDRIGGKHGNKNIETTATALKMVAIKSSLKK